VARRRELDAPGDVLAEAGAGRDVEDELEVAGRAREGALDRHSRGRVRHEPAREVTGARQEGLARTMAVDAAEGGRHADRSAEVAAELDRGEAARERGRAAASAAAGRALEVPWVVRAAEERVVALPVGGHGRDVGLAEQDDAGGAQAGGGRGVAVDDRVAPFGLATGDREAAPVDAVLQDDREAEQRGGLPTGACRVGRACGLVRIRIRRHDRVERRVVTGDPGAVEIEQLDRGELAGIERGEHRAGGRERVHRAARIHWANEAGVLGLGDG
jgi:hypothetical protein